MFPKITKRDRPEIISGHLSQVTKTCGLLHIGGGHHRCTRAFENKPSSLIRALTPYSVNPLTDTDPLSSDIDGDGFSDFDEVTIYGTDPLDSNSIPIIANGDLNADGLFNIGDVLVIQRKALGIVNF